MSLASPVRFELGDNPDASVIADARELTTIFKGEVGAHDGAALDGGIRGPGGGAAAPPEEELVVEYLGQAKFEELGDGIQELPPRTRSTWRVQNRPRRSLVRSSE